MVWCDMGYTDSERRVIGGWLHDARRAARLTNANVAREHVARVTGARPIDYSTWASYESGRRRVTERHAALIEAAFGRPPIPWEHEAEAAQVVGAADVRSLVLSNQLLADRVTALADLVGERLLSPDELAAVVVRALEARQAARESAGSTGRPSSGAPRRGRGALSVVLDTSGTTDEGR